MNKYNVGQSVYLVCCEENYGDTMVHPDMMVINRVSKDHLGYHYSLTDSNEDIIDWCREEDVFINKYDAELESRKRNALELLNITGEYK